MTQIKLRRDTAANFTSKNPVLGNGEPAYETDTKKLKIGDGTTAYTQLEYFSAGGGSSTNISATLPLKIVNGVISLEVDGQTIQIVDGKLEQEKINHLTCTALDLATFIKQAGLTDAEVLQFLNANPSLKIQLTLCKDVYCGVVRQLCPLKITETLTLTDDMVVEFFKKKHNIK